MIQEFADCAPSGFDRPGLGGADAVLELGEELLDRIEVGAVGGQKDQMRPGLADLATYPDLLVAAEIVENHHVAWPQAWNQKALDIQAEECAVDGPVDHPGRLDPVMAQGGDEGQGAPMPVRHTGHEPLAARPPSAQRRHVSLDPGLVQKDQALRGDPALMRLPAPALAGDVRPGALRRLSAFF